MRVLTADEIQIVAGGDDPTEVAPVIVQGHSPTSGDNPIGWLAPFSGILTGLAGSARSIVSAIAGGAGGSAAVAAAGPAIVVGTTAGVVVGAATQTGNDVNTPITHYAGYFNMDNPIQP